MMNKVNVKTASAAAFITFFIGLSLCLVLLLPTYDKGYRDGFSAATQFDCGDAKYYYNLYHKLPGAAEALNNHMDTLNCPKDRLYQHTP
jgi:hypothetical protein